MSAVDSEASTSSSAHRIPKSTSDGQLLLHSDRRSSSQGSITPPLPSGGAGGGGPRGMKPFILRGKSAVPPQGPSDLGSPPSTSTAFDIDRLSLSSGPSSSHSHGGKSLTRTKSVDGARGLSKRASVVLSPPAPAPQPSRHRSKPSRSSSVRTDSSSANHPPAARQPRMRKPRPASVQLSASEVRNAQAVEALKIKRQKEAALGRRYSTFDINIHPGPFHHFGGASPEPLAEAGEEDEGAGPSSRGPRKASSRASLRSQRSNIEKENALDQQQMQSQSRQATPKKTLRRIASISASPLRTPTRQPRGPSKAASYSNLKQETPLAVEKQSPPPPSTADSPVHFTSMEQLLQEQGFQHTRVFTPPQPLRHHKSSAELLQHALNPTAPPSPPVVTALSPTAASPTMLGAELHPSAAQSLRPKSSMLSLRGLLSLWSGSGGPIDGEAVSQLRQEDDDERFGLLNPIDLNEGGSELGSDDTTIERRLVRASAWVHCQAGHTDDEFPPPKHARSKFGSADAERSMAYSSFGLRAAEMAADDDDGGRLARDDGQSLAEAYAAGYRQAMEMQKQQRQHQRPPVIRTSSHLADPSVKRRSLRHVVSESALVQPPAATGPGSSLIGAHESGYESFAFVSAGLGLSLDYDDDQITLASVDGPARSRTAEVRLEYDGSSDTSDAGAEGATLGVPAASSGRGMLSRPISGIWSGVSTLTHKASTLFFGPGSQSQVPAIEVDSSATETETEAELDHKPRLLRKASTAAMRLAPVVTTGGEFDGFDWGMDGLTGSRK